MNRLLYIGAWNHLSPVITFKDTKEFIFIDTQPRSEWDSLSYNKEYYRQKFVPDVISKMKKYNFTLMDTIIVDNNYCKKIMNVEQLKHSDKLPKYINPTLLIFSNNETNQIVKYYISTNIKYNMNQQLSEDIKNSDTLIVSGYFPDAELFKYLTKPIDFYGYSNTYYKTDEYDGNNIAHYLDISEKSDKYFKNYYKVYEDEENHNNTKIVKLLNYKNFYK